MTNPDVIDDTDGTSLFELFAEFNLTLSGLRDQIQRQNDMAQEDNRRNLPRQLPLVRASLNSATTADVLDFGGPQPGRKWEIRGLVALALSAGGAFTTLATTIVTAYAGQNVLHTNGVPGVLVISQARWQFPSIPASQKFGADELAIVPQDHLLVGLTGIPAPPSNIEVVALINDLPLFSARAVAVS